MKSTGSSLGRGGAYIHADEAIARTIVKCPPTDADPGLQASLLFLELGEPIQEGDGVLIHGNDLKRGRFEEDEGEVDVREIVQGEVLGGDSAGG